MASPGFNLIYYVSLYGAKWDGVTDDAAAIQATIDAASAAGGGTVVLPVGKGAFGSQLNVPAFVRLIGNGLWITQLNALSSSQNGITVTGKYAQVSDFFLSAPLGNTGTGLSIASSPNCIFKNLQISEFISGFAQQQSPDANIENVLCSNSSNSNSIGFTIDGTVKGNVSSIYRDCSAVGLQTGTNDKLNAANAGKTGWHIFSSTANGDCGDLSFFNCSVSNAGTAAKIDFTNALQYSDASSDIIWEDFVFDLFTGYGFQILGGDDATLVKLNGGFLDAAPYGTSSVVGIYGSNRGLLISGIEWIPVLTSFSFGAYATFIAGQDAVVTGCSFNGWDHGLYVDGGKVTAIGNRFFTTEGAAGSLIGRTMNAVEVYNSTGSIVTGNLIGASVSHGIATAITFESSAGFCAAISNDLTSANIDAKVLNNSATSILADNPGYNPVGAMVPPTVTTGTYTYTNSSGVLQFVNVSGGNVTSITANGVLTGLLAGSFAVPSGKSLVVVNTAAPTLTVSGD